MINITMLKLPTHTTDFFQPLDVSVFESLKEKLGMYFLNNYEKRECTDKGQVIYSVLN